MRALSLIKQAENQNNDYTTPALGALGTAGLAAGAYGSFVIPKQYSKKRDMHMQKINELSNQLDDLFFQEEKAKQEHFMKQISEKKPEAEKHLKLSDEARNKKFEIKDQIEKLKNDRKYREYLRERNMIYHDLGMHGLRNNFKNEKQEYIENIEKKIQELQQQYNHYHSLDNHHFKKYQELSKPTPLDTSPFEEKREKINLEIKNHFDKAKKYLQYSSNPLYKNRMLLYGLGGLATAGALYNHFKNNQN